MGRTWRHHVVEKKVPIMILDPLGYVPVEVEMRTTMARAAFRAQPRRPRRRRTRRIDWDRVRHPLAHVTHAR